MDHSDRVTQEFARQAEAFASAPVVTDEALTARIACAVSPSMRGRTLDLACGPGILTEALARTGGEVVGFDLTPQMLERARERCRKTGLRNVSFLQGDAGALPFPDGHFDAAVTRFAVHHFPDPARVMGEMARVLRPGGTAVVADVVSSSDAEESRLHNALETLRDPSHARMLPREALRALVEGAGLAIEDESVWSMAREFGEWARIASDPARTQPLRVVMEALARAGLRAGIGLRLEGSRLIFDHHSLLLKAKKPAVR